MIMSAIIDLTNLSFNEWTVIEHAGSDKRGRALWRCRCSCGTIKIIVGSTLRNGASKSCGCKRTENSRENNGTFVNEVGNRYGKLTVISKDNDLSKKRHRAMWICLCDCGNYKTVSSKCLRDGKTKSCGCILSVGEETIHSILTRHNVAFQSQYGVSINKKWYRFDFAIFTNDNLTCLIEYHGAQHYDTEHLHWGKPIEVNQQRDDIKKTVGKRKQYTTI